MKWDDDFDPVQAGFSAFRKGWPQYRASIFRDKVEIVTDGNGKILGATNPDSLLFAHFPSSAEGIQILEIGERAFSACTHLRDVTFSDNLEYVGKEAFKDCASLERVEFKGKEIEFGEGVFSSSGLRSFSFPEETEHIPTSFFSDCKRLSLVSLPKGYRTLGSLCFSGTKSLRAIDLGFSIKEIPDGCFLSSAIESISIPRSVQRIGVSAFSLCSNLKKIWYDGSADDFRRIEFGMNWNRGINRDAILYVKDKNGLWTNAFERAEEEKSVREKMKNEDVEKNLKILGLDSLVSMDELSSAYRREAMKFHPDTISSLKLPKEYEEFASSRFRVLHDAYVFLSEVIRDKK